LPSIKSISILLAMFLILPAAMSVADTSAKIKPAVRQAMQASARSASHLCWLYLDETTAAGQPVSLTPKAKARRARVDPDRLLIDSHDMRVQESLIKAIEQSGVRVRRVSRWFKAVSVEATSAQIEVLASRDFVREIDLVRVLRAYAPVEETPLTHKAVDAKALTLNYGFSTFQNDFINAPKLHRAGLEGQGVTIAIFDSGFKTDHPAFDSASIVATYDFINDDTIVDGVDCPDDALADHQDYHGTLVAGVIAGYAIDTLIGVAHQADLVLAKTEMTCGGTEIKLEEDNWVAAAEWADSIGADIITSSVGYYVFQDSGSYTFDDLDGNTALVTRAADMAASKNILVVNAAGNERGTPWNHIITPSDGDSVVAVGAVTSDSALAGFSSPGPTADGRIKPDIVSLGVGVLASRNIGGYANVSGTSFSTPLVAAGAALALQHDMTLTAEEIRQFIIQSGDRFDNPDNNYGYGLYDAARAANITAIDQWGTVRVGLGETILVPITSSGRSPEIPSLSALNLPIESSFIDSFNGRGLLRVVGSAANPAFMDIGLVADVGYFVDTFYLGIETYAPSDRLIFAGPNPFTNSVRIFLTPEAGNLESISIFNSAGEKVWEKVNMPGVSADDITEWNGHNLHGQTVSSGAYVAFVKTDRLEAHVKLLKIK